MKIIITSIFLFLSAVTAITLTSVSAEPAGDSTAVTQNQAHAAAHSAGSFV
ncbi:hypothetical protein ACETRX_12490 [Labrys portucalensis]|jgi:hypothetical protein|uniref:Uncharacterized protein n=1 Tax=Labrys neptuniae TaxID=376174 RepID=A0ABV6ZE00_9HYPH|nr:MULTISPECIES: hypothetical protein [unclassified Labrys (in: a-proteobacteria)]MDZ5449505.1 hypothetical protein [Labrys sp. ZIDIC5]